MTWTAPETQRPARPTVADEPTALAAALDHQRATFLFKCGGLTAEQLAARPLLPSPLSLLGLARHLAECERTWFCHRFAGRPLELLYVTEDNEDADLLDGTPATAEHDLAVLHTEIDAARAAVRSRSLDDTFHRKDQEIDLRWLMHHMIEEYARHNGHADLIREHLDGRTGE